MSVCHVMLKEPCNPTGFFFVYNNMKEDLIKLYESWLSDDDITEFQRLMFKRAIFFLNAGHKPKKVENWVVSIEKKWTYLK